MLLAFHTQVLNEACLYFSHPIDFGVGTKWMECPH
jgi:hypothetical protein